VFPIPPLVDTLRDLAREAEHAGNPLQARRFIRAADLLEAEPPEDETEMLHAISIEGFTAQLIEGADGSWTAEIAAPGESSGLLIDPMPTRSRAVRQAFAGMWSTIIGAGGTGVAQPP
jgi:hypothetical protein